MLLKEWEDIMIRSFEELYKKTDNPLSEQTLETLLQLKVKYVTYRDLVTQYSKNKKNKVNREGYNSRGELYTALFETWKNGILSLNKQQISKPSQYINCDFLISLSLYPRR